MGFSNHLIKSTMVYGSSYIFKPRIQNRRIRQDWPRRPRGAAQFQVSAPVTLNIIGIIGTLGGFGTRGLGLGLDNFY